MNEQQLAEYFCKWCNLYPGHEEIPLSDILHIARENLDDKDFDMMIYSKQKDLARLFIDSTMAKQT